MKRLSLKKWDVFSIPINADTQGFGHILDNGKIPYIFVYKFFNIFSLDLTKNLSDQILFCESTPDARLYHGIWTVIQNHPIPENVIPRPYYKVGYQSDTWVESFDCKLIRVANLKETEFLHRRSARAPIAFENGLKNYHAGLPIDSSMDKYRYDQVVAHTELARAI